MLGSDFNGQMEEFSSNALQSFVTYCYIHDPLSLFHGPFLLQASDQYASEQQLQISIFLCCVWD